MSSFCHTQQDAIDRQKELKKKQCAQSLVRFDSVKDDSVYSNIGRFGKEVINDNISPQLPYQQRVLQKALEERKPGRHDDNFKCDLNKPTRKGVNDCSMTLFLERKHQVGMDSRQEYWSDRSVKQPRRAEMQGMSQAQILDRIKHDPYFVRRQVHSQKYPEGATWNNSDSSRGRVYPYSRGPVDPFLNVANK
jgi:hypothetical protein